MLRWCLALLLSASLSLQADDASAHAQRAASLQAAGNYAEAIAEYRAALKLAPDNSGLLINLGDALAHNGDLQQAVAAYRSALRIAPGSEPALLNLGLAYYKLALWKEVAATFASYRKSHPLDLRTGSVSKKATAAGGGHTVPPFAFHSRNDRSSIGPGRTQAGGGMVAFRIGQSADRDASDSKLSRNKRLAIWRDARDLLGAPDAATNRCGLVKSLSCETVAGIRLENIAIRRAVRDRIASSSHLRSPGDRPF